MGRALCIKIDVLVDEILSDRRGNGVFWVLLLAAEGAAEAVGDVGFEAAVAVHVPAQH